MCLGKRQLNVWSLGVLLLSAGPWWAGLAAAGTLYVSPVGTNNAPTYPDWAGAATSPNAAINAAADGDTVSITNETYTLTNQISVTNGVTVQGYGGRPTISGGGSVRCFSLNHTNAVLDTLAIIRGSVNGYGGGVYIANGGTVQNCLVYSNASSKTAAPGGRGGGIYIATTGNVFSCLIVSNTTSYNSDISAGGGGIRVDGSGVIQNSTSAYNNVGTIFCGAGMYISNGLVDSCLIGPGNLASDGGGIYMAGGVMTNCVVSNNTAGWSEGTGGAGVWLKNGTVRNCIIVTNFLQSSAVAGSYGGGVRMENGFLLDCAIVSNRMGASFTTCAGIYMSGGLVSNCDIVGNISPYISGRYGGGVYMSGGTVRDCRILSQRQVTHFGGGVYMSAGTLQGCIVSNNTAYVCGGVAANGAGCVVQDCTIVNNDASHNSLSPFTGGGVYANGATVSNCTIAFNRSAHSGAGVSIIGAARVNNCRIVGNSYYSTYYIHGGGVSFFSGASGMVANCTIVSNDARGDANGVGGGVDFYGVGVVVRDCLIAANYAGYGGGVYNWPANTGLLQNCTIVGNMANYSGGGVYGGAATNCIIYSNRYINTASSNVFSGALCGYCCSTPPDLTNGVKGNITSEPRFLNGGSGFGTAHITGNYRPMNNSPCLNAGVNESWMTNAVDLDGRRRIVNNIVDMGAYEFMSHGALFSFR